MPNSTSRLECLRWNAEVLFWVSGWPAVPRVGQSCSVLQLSISLTLQLLDITAARIRFPACWYGQACLLLVWCVFFCGQHLAASLLQLLEAPTHSEGAIPANTHCFERGSAGVRVQA